MTRQVERREIFESAMQAVNRSNLHRVFLGTQTVGWSGMSRNERRKLARAYAAKAWKDRKLANQG